jgi:O-antigen ligase
MRLVLLAAMTAALPLLVPRGPGNTAPVDIFAVLFAFLVFAEAVVARRRLVLPAVGPLFLIAVVSAVTVVFSVAPGTGLTNLLIEAYLVALLWAVCNELRGHPERVALITSVWVVAAVFWAFLLVGTQWHLLPNGLEHLMISSDSSGRAAAAARNPNLAASFFVTSTFVTMFSPWPRSHFVRGAIYAWLLTAVVVSGSNGALLGAIVGGAVLAVMHVVRESSHAKRRLLGALLAIVAGVGIFSVVASGSNISQHTADKIAQSSDKHGALKDNLGRLNDSVATRVSIWSSALKGGFDHSALGVGVGAAQTIQVGDNQALGKSLHNDILAFLLERGVVGLAALLLLIGLIMRWCTRLARAGPTQLDGRLWRLQALPAAVAATIAISLTHESYHFRHLWMLLALVWVMTDLVTAPAVQTVPERVRATATPPLRRVHVPA